MSVFHRTSSVAFPHSNCRAEVGVKTARRMIMENTDHAGSIDIPKFQRAMLQYRNTPSSLDNKSPAEIVFGRQIRDFIPVKPGKYLPYATWNREEAFMQRHAKEVEKLGEHTKRLPPLKVGDHVRVQNQTGNSPHNWDRSGVVVEVRQFDQYVVKVHGSGRPTLRNRKFLRKYTPYVVPSGSQPVMTRGVVSVCTPITVPKPTPAMTTPISSDSHNNDPSSELNGHNPVQPPSVGINNNNNSNNNTNNNNSNNNNNNGNNNNNHIPEYEAARLPSIASVPTPTMMQAQGGRSAATPPRRARSTRANRGRLPAHLRQDYEVTMK
jgi:hypothetical protein